MLLHVRTVIAVLCLLWLATFGAPSPVATAPAPVSTEVRGLWVIRTSLTSAERVDEVIRTAVDGGYNTLLVQVRGRGDAYYTSALEPRAQELQGQPVTFDPLQRTIERAHAAGLQVHAWFNVNLVASAVTLPQERQHVMVRHPEWMMVPQALASAMATRDPRGAGYLTPLARWTRDQSATVEGLFLSPIPEGAQQYTLSILRDLLERYALDGLHLDYIRYPTADFDYSAGALDAFRADRYEAATPAERQRLDTQRRTDPTAWTRAYPQAWDAFRRDRLTTLVTRIRALVQETRPQAVVSAAVFPVPADARRQKLQDWSLWAERGWLDAVAPMAYATTVPEFSRQIQASKAGAHGRPVWAGIGAWRLPVARTADHIRAARAANAEGILLFSYDSLLTAVSPRGAYFTRLRPALLTVNDDR